MKPHHRQWRSNPFDCLKRRNELYNLGVKKLLREPLLHFLLLGAAIFVAYGLVAERGGEEPGRIVITRGQIENLAAGFAAARLRPPSAEELAELVRDRVREEVFCREAMALGMDKDDLIIRRRLRQKMEFTFENIIALAEPTDADLNAYLQAHPDSFRVEPRFTFRHVYLNPDKRGGNMASDAAQLLAQLNESANAVDASTLGDSFMLESRFEALPMEEVAKVFGEEFAGKLNGLSPGQWQGPIESGYGAHLVIIDDRDDARLPALTEVRDLVRREWEHARRLEANEKFYQELLGRYTIIIEGLEPSAQETALTKGDAE